MIGIIISGHGNFATGMLSALQMIAGECKNVAAVDFAMSDSTDDLIKKLHETVECFKHCEEVIFFTDVLGGSPFKCSVLVSQTMRGKVIAGTNLPMLMEAAFLRNSGTLEAIHPSVLEAGGNGIKYFDDGIKKIKKTSAVGI